jgi:two-component system, cell cycle sensor histidine kinase and response regulator CckA
VDEKQAQANPRARPGEHVWLSVSDTGCGIPADILPRIFEPFFTTKPAGKGTGLGLATVYGIIEQHHGWIDVATETGKGTTFRVFFPVSEGPRTEHKRGFDSTQLPVGNETVLLVEDDISLRLLVSQILERCGYKVLPAASGMAAIEVWKTNREQIALLLTDLVMPEGINGFDLAKTLQGEKPGLKVVFTSGYAAKAGEGPPLFEGVNFLQKPYSSQKLAQALRNCLDQR